MDQNDEHLAANESYNERDKDIVGKAKREKVENLSGPIGESKKNLTVQQKIQSELRYLTEALDLDAPSQKHWYYKLKREYEEQEKTRKRMEGREARKNYRNMMKKLKLEELDNLEDYDSFYTDKKNDISN